MKKLLASTIIVSMMLFNKILPKSNLHIKPVKDCSTKVIIFDLGDVLFETSKAAHASTIIASSFIHPTLFYTLATSNLKENLFSNLAQVPSQTNAAFQQMYNNGKPMPQIMVDWMTGVSKSQEILKQSIDHIQKSNESPNQTYLLAKIMELLFNPLKFAQSQKPVKAMVKLAKALKVEGYQLYILSNWDPESFPLLQKLHPTIFNLFDGCLISGTEGIGKPNPNFYNKLLKQYNLTNSECLFIDDEPFNTQMAETLGISSILKTSNNSVHDSLKDKGIIQKL